MPCGLALMWGTSGSTGSQDILGWSRDTKYSRIHGPPHMGLPRILQAWYMCCVFGDSKGCPGTGCGSTGHPSKWRVSRVNELSTFQRTMLPPVKSPDPPPLLSHTRYWKWSALGLFGSAWERDWAFLTLGVHFWQPKVDGGGEEGGQFCLPKVDLCMGPVLSRATSHLLWRWSWRAGFSRVPWKGMEGKREVRRLHTPSAGPSRSLVTAEVPPHSLLRSEVAANVVHEFLYITIQVIRAIENIRCLHFQIVGGAAEAELHSNASCFPSPS